MVEKTGQNNKLLMSSIPSIITLLKTDLNYLVRLFSSFKRKKRENCISKLKCKLYLKIIKMFGCGCARYHRATQTNIATNDSAFRIKHLFYGGGVP